MTKPISTFRRDRFRTSVEVNPLERPLRYTQKIMLLGSCFAENMGSRLQSLKYQTIVNPFGIVYNPLSMASQIDRMLHRTTLTGDELVFHQDLWHSWMHHGRFSDPDKDRLLRRAEEELTEASGFLEDTRILLLTFGTPVVWYLKEGNRLVSNCHQVPSDRFQSRRARPEELAGVWIPLIRSLLERNPGLQIGLTISPVRYFREGPEGNQMSKAVLFLFAEMLRERFPEIFYFPAYEIFMDDLRDYRFYDTDLIHPGPAGIDYTWDRFAGACLDPAEASIREEVESVWRAVNHRPRSAETASFREFTVNLLRKMDRLQSQHPFLDFSRERDILSGRAGSDQA